MSTTTERIAKTVTVADGVTARKYEQTASRDHNVTLEPGTYELRADYSPEKHLLGYWATIPAIAHEHTASTVEFGGVALAWEQRGGERESYSFHAYPWQLDSYAADGQYAFGYEEV